MAWWNTLKTLIDIVSPIAHDRFVDRSICPSVFIMTLLLVTFLRNRFILLRTCQAHNRFTRFVKGLYWCGPPLVHIRSTSEWTRTGSQTNLCRNELGTNLFLWPDTQALGFQCRSYLCRSEGIFNIKWKQWMLTLVELISLLSEENGPLNQLSHHPENWVQK